MNWVKPAKMSSTGMVAVKAVGGNIPAMTVPVIHVPVAKSQSPSGAGAAMVAVARSSRNSISSCKWDTTGPDFVQLSRLGRGVT